MASEYRIHPPKFSPNRPIMPKSHPESPDESLSSVFDGENIDDGHTGVDVDRARKLTAEWQQIGDALRAPPAAAVDLSPAIMAELRQTTVSDSTDVRWRSGKSSVVRRWLAIGASSLAVLLIGFAISHHLTAPIVETQFTLLTESSVASADWDVLVVTVPDNDGHNTAEYVRNSVADHGLQLQSLVRDTGEEHNHPDILMASGDDSAAFRSIFASTDHHFTTEFNPDSIDGLDREQLLQRLAESVEAPTKSDEYFGEMLVAVPNDGSIVVMTVPQQTKEKANIAAAGSTNSDTPADDANAQSVSTPKDATLIAEFIKRGKNKPVVVVLRRAKKPTAPKHQGALDGAGQKTSGSA